MNQIVEALYARSICHLQYKSELPRIVVEDRMALSLNIQKACVLAACFLRPMF